MENTPKYTAEGLFQTEEEAKKDLDTCGYAGKWRKAKDAVARGEHRTETPAYWDAVRLYFLELGGCWLAQRNPPVPADFVAPVVRERYRPAPGLPTNPRQG